MKKILFTATIFTFIFSACDKNPVAAAKSQLDEQSSQLIIDWTNVQFRLIKNTTGVAHPAFSRHFSYTGIALYESLVHGDNKKMSIASLLNGSIHLPAPYTIGRVFFPLSANAVFAEMFRFFYASKESNLQIIDSLETAYQNKYTDEVRNNFDIDASVQYGKKVAAAVIELSKTDGASNAAVPYTPLGEGYWEPTAPAYAAAAVPGWANNRTILPGSTNNTTPAAPLVFSKEAGSPFYNMVKELYDISQTLTNEQKATAAFWDDAPNGKYITAFGHWFNILKQLLQKENSPLMKGAEAYLRLGITMNESTITCWKSKYTFSQMRPITYIRKYMGNTTWSSFITTPAHPEYLAAHATISSSAAYALESVFGKNYAFADHTYETLGMPVRNYNSIEAAGTEAGISRLYGGIHYRPSIEAGKMQGVKVGENVKNMLITNK
jgi:hypothetical protein